MEIPLSELYLSSLFSLVNEITEVFSPKRVATLGDGGYDIAQCLKARGAKVHHEWTTGNRQEDFTDDGIDSQVYPSPRNTDLLIIAPYSTSGESYPYYLQDKRLEDSNSQGDYMQGDSSQGSHIQNVMNPLDPTNEVSSPLVIQLNEFINTYGPPTVASILCIPPPYCIQGLRSPTGNRIGNINTNTGNDMDINPTRSESKQAEPGDDLHEINKLTKQTHAEITDILLQSGQYEASYHALGKHDEWSVYTYISSNRLDWYADLLQEELESTQLLCYQAEFELNHLKKAFSDAQLSKSWKIAYKLAGILYRNKASDPI